jgi:flavin reductase (DIM6/NTAB) family NADH-FMN oxidoreductase RutF
MKRFPKKDFPVDKVRRFIEPGHIVLVSSVWKGDTNIMTMGWHMMMEYTLIGCYIWDRNHSREMVRRSGECVINVPTIDLLNEAIGIGNSTGAEVDKFARFALTPVAGDKVKAPLIDECYASFECKLHDASQAEKYSLFIWEVVKAHVATAPKYPKTFHYRGDGVFMISDGNVSRRRQFKPEML